MDTVAILREAAARFGAAAFLVEERKTLSYQDVDRQSNAMALGLKALGVAKGERVALYMNGASEFVVTRFAVQKLGALIVPLNTRLSPAELRHILGDCEPCCVVGDSALLQNLQEKWRRIAVAVGPGAEGLPHYEELLKEGSEKPPAVQLDAEDDAMILYTSGTTGLPKGAVIGHRNSVASGKWILEITRFSPNDVLLSCIPMYSASSMNGFLIASLIAGTPWVITEKFSPAGVLKEVQQKRVTVLHGTGAHHAMMASQPSYSARTLSSLRLLTWSNVLALQTLERMQSSLPGVQFIQLYGMTETSPMGSHISTPAMLERPTSCGKATPGFTEVRVVDAEGKEAAPDVPGEVVIRCLGLMREYYKNPQATREAIRDGWFYTGDLGKMDREGYLHIVGRVKDVINRAGEKIFAPEVEAVLASHPAIQDVALIGVPDPVLGEELSAFVVKKADAEISAEELRGHCQGKLASFKIPKQIEFIEALPKNTMGKTLKYLLKERARSGANAPKASE